jgi:hypothetical protein
MASGGERASGGQGRVKDPMKDGRLKENRARGVSLAETRADRQPGGQGRVKNIESDRRLKRNKDGDAPSSRRDEHHDDGRSGSRP